MKKNQEEQSSWQIYPKKISHDVTQVESDTASLALVKYSKNNNSIQFVNRIKDSGSLGFLPAELLLQILGYFTLHELYGLKLIHTSWQQTIQGLPHIELLHTYEIALKGSKLWHYLPAIIKNESILTFIKERLLPYKLPKYREKQFDKITAFSTWIPDKLILKNFDLSYRKKLNSDNLIQQAQFIWNNVKQFGQADDEKLENWYVFLWKHHEIQLSVSEAYLELEGILTAILFIIRFRHPEADMVRILCDSPANRWLRGEDLLFLIIRYFSLFYEMVKQFVYLHAYFKDPGIFMGHVTDLGLSNKFQQRLFVLDNLLSRLTSLDWLQYFELESNIQYYYTALLEKLIETNHPVISKQLSEIFSFRGLERERIPQILDKETIESVLLSLHFDDNKGQSDDGNHTILESAPWLQEGYELLQDAEIQLAATRKQNQEIKEYLKNFNETQRQIQEQLDSIASNNAKEDDVEEQNQDFLSPRPSSLQFLVPPPLVSVKPPVTNEHVAPTSFNWRLALKIGVLVLIALIGIGLVFTGVGAFMCIPLLITLSLPLIIKSIVLTVGVVSLLASCAIGICTYYSIKKGKQNEPMIAASPPDERLRPTPVVKRDTMGMIQIFNKAPSPSNAEQEDFLCQTSLATYYASPLTYSSQLQNKKQPQESGSQSHVFKLI
jgi:hypothetical protein